LIVAIPLAFVRDAYSTYLFYKNKGLYKSLEDQLQGGYKFYHERWTVVIGSDFSRNLEDQNYKLTFLSGSLKHRLHVECELHCRFIIEKAGWLSSLVSTQKRRVIVSGTKFIFQNYPGAR
jgi:hypothetical protein